MVATWQPAAPANYYKTQTAYYLGGVERRGRWYAPGGDFALKDGADVDLETFERLYAGIGPDGQSLISNQGGRASDRVGAHDLTFSPPRSLSMVLVWARPEIRQAIEDAHDRAVRAALQMVEREACYARRGHGGERIEKVALTAAVFMHGESRPAKHIDGKIFADMNCHHHAVCLSLATRADGTVGALHSQPLRDAKLLAGSVYHAALSFELQALEFAIDRVGYNGAFEIRGVDDDLINYSSARRNEIDQELEKHGVTSKEAGALASAIARSTRAGKSAEASLRREQIWADAAMTRGVDVENFSDNLRRAERSLDIEAAETLFEERLADLPRALTDDRSVFERKDLLRAVASALVGTGLPVSRIDPEVEHLLQTQAIVEIGRDRLDRPRYSTPEMVRIEREVVDRATRLAERHGFALGRADLLRHCSRAGLSVEQTDAACAATGDGALALMLGAPGSGKSKTLPPIVASYLAAGHRVLGAAGAWRTANTLAGELSIPSRALASWLETARRGGEFLKSGDVLIIDEAGLINSRDMHSLVGEVERIGAKLLLVGDPKQLQAIGSAGGLGLVMRAIEGAGVETIVRQHSQWQRDAIRAFGEGRAKDALQAFAERGCLVEAAGAKATIGAVVDQWRALRSRDPVRAPLLIARTNADVAAISRAVREVLRSEGRITGPDIEFSTATPSGQTTSIALARGDQIRFLTRSRDLGVINGSVGTVVAIKKRSLGGWREASSIRIVAMVDGRRVEFSPQELADNKGRARIGWAYASSVYQSQGMTVDHAIVLVDPGFDRRQIYVAASRARMTTTFVANGKAIDRLLAADLPLDQQRREPEFTSEKRAAWLAKRLSQAHAKESRLDVLMPHLERSDARPRRNEMHSRQDTGKSRDRSTSHSREASLD